MANIDVNSTKVVCVRCGTAYNRRKGNFAVSYGALHKGIGYIPVCKECVDKMYNSYISECGSSKDAVRRLCRNLNVYWNESVFEEVEKKNTTRTIMTAYLQKVATSRYVGKSYDDTLTELGKVWEFSSNEVKPEQPIYTSNSVDEAIEEIEIPDDVILFWGKGYSPDMYLDLEQRLSYWLSKFPEGTELDPGAEAIIKQICSLELDINRDRAAGRPVDKSINALNSLLGSANLKPAQKKQEDNDTLLNNTPMGVWINRFEHHKPIPDRYEDSKLLRYVFTWMGHLCRMLGIKNSYEELYQREIDRLRVEKPQYDGDDESFMMDVMNESLGDQDG